MRNGRLFLLTLFLLTGCGKKFSKSLAEAEISFSERNYINVIDTLTNSIPRWKESDGNDKKSRAYELMGLSYHQLRNIEKAMEAYAQAVPLSTKSTVAAVQLGNLYLLKSRGEEARRTFQAALRIKPDDPLALLGLGNSEFLLKHRAEASAAFEKVLDASPGVREALESLNAMYAKRNEKTLYLRKSPTKKKPHFK